MRIRTRLVLGGRALATVASVGLAFGASSASASVHPGLQHTRAELDTIKANVNGTAPHPMKDGWAQMLTSPRASLSYAPTPYAIVHVVSGNTNAEEDALRNDGVAAYAHALQWVVTGDPRHAQKAIQIIDAWSAVFVEIVPAPGSFGVQKNLEADWYAPQWLNAAEILRHYGDSGWSAEGVQRFHDRMVAHFKELALGWGGSTGCCPNQGVSAAYARMTIGAYLDDPATYESGLNHFVNTMLPRSIAANGELLELNRSPNGDCGHSSYNLEGDVQIAELAYHQGTDLYQLKLGRTPRRGS